VERQVKYELKYLRSAVVALGAAGLVVALAGCSTEAVLTTAQAPIPAVSQSAAAVTVPATAPTVVAVAAPVTVPAPKPAVAPSSSACAGIPAGVKQIVVSISDQHLWACAGNTLFTDSAVTTGASALTNVHDATPVGQFHVTGKVRNTVLAGHDVNGAWNDPVTYWMPFSGGVGFHDSPWQTFPLGSALYKTQGSHGCVHVDAAEIGKIFDWAQVGTAVIIRS